MKLSAMEHNTSIRRCAFCRHWYDPANKHIEPRPGCRGSWTYDGDAREQCLLNHFSKLASSYCQKFECKL